MKCGNCWNCNGFMVLKSRHVEGKSEEGYFTTYDDSVRKPPPDPLNRVYPQGHVWVAGHKMPVFAQCCECGYTPLPEEQPQAVKTVLEEVLETL